MKARVVLAVLMVAGGGVTHAAEDVFDRLDEALTWSSSDAAARARVSGLLDFEQYWLPDPAPGVIDADGSSLFTPRLAVFFDAQWNRHLYAFAQIRVDRRFDPSPDRLRARLDEYAVRWSVGTAGWCDLEAGKFATVVGSWAPRHDSWNNPFITAPLPYENLTGVWDNEPPRSATQLLVWSHVRPGISPGVQSAEKYLRIPIIWGPSYATGVAVAGAIDKVRYAVEIKNASLSSRPDAWSPRESGLDHPTVSGRFRYIPDPRWEFGWSASTGSFLRPVAQSLLAPSVGRAQYRQSVLGEDVSFAWHHLQVWAEVYASRFQLPGIGNADTLAYYVEARQRLTPGFSLAIRWNEQLYGTILERGHPMRWGNGLWRIDLAPTYRLSAHAQLKLQYSVQSADQDSVHLTQLAAVQATLRF